LVAAEDVPRFLGHLRIAFLRSDNQPARVAECSRRTRSVVPFMIGSGADVTARSGPGGVPTPIAFDPSLRRAAGG
jgi:hypothetical protein